MSGKQGHVSLQLHVMSLSGGHKPEELGPPTPHRPCAVAGRWDGLGGLRGHQGTWRELSVAGAEGSTGTRGGERQRWNVDIFPRAAGRCLRSS